MLDYDSIGELARRAASEAVTIGRLVLADQAEQLDLPQDALLRRMHRNLDVMRAAARDGAQKELSSTSGLTGGDG